MLLQAYFPAAVTALSSLVASLLLASSSRSFGAVVYAMPAKIELGVAPTTPAVASSSSIGSGGDVLPRNLFELPSPFEAVNDQCARVCSSQQEEEEEGNNDGNNSLINVCPKVS